MLNNNEINWYDLNYNTWESNIQNESEVLSSFSSSQITKYAIKTPLWQYFNIWNFWTYDSWICWEWEMIRYWNILIDSNVEDLATKEIKTANNPILNGWIIQNTRFSEKNIEFTLELKSKDKKSFEKEIRDIKRNFNYKGTKLTKKEFDRISEIDVELDDTKVWTYKSKWNEITIYFKSLDPNFKKPSWNSKAYRNITWNLDASLIITDTDIEPFIETLIDIKEVTGTIDEIHIEFDWYKIEIECSIDSPEKVVFNWKKSQIFVWNTEIEDFKWKFRPFSINKPKSVKATFIWGTADKYSIYFSYDNIYL